ncbi:hypothetical protein [Microcoleus sp. D2_18a_D3]|uniref:hypothetical protein n=1 Tax=Microcoleus sp. D2_18a_D3 TaxID=3055330 RepID=UPI002FD0063D
MEFLPWRTNGWAGGLVDKKLKLTPLPTAVSLPYFIFYTPTIDCQKSLALENRNNQSARNRLKSTKYQDFYLLPND